MTTLALLSGVLFVMVTIAASMWVSNAAIALTPSDPVEIDPICTEPDFSLTQNLPVDNDSLPPSLLKAFKIGFNF